MSSVSVVMTVFNGEVFIKEQIDSVLRELLPGDEFIFVIDSSPDSSLEIVNNFNSKLIKVYENNSNIGVVASFERGLRLAAHEIVFLCDQDDIWLPGKRAAFVRTFEEDPQVLVVISDAQIIDRSGLITGESFMAMRGGFRGGVWSTLVRNRYIGCAMAVRRELIRKALPFPRRVPMHDMWLGVLGRTLGRVHYKATPFIQYRRHGGNASPSRHQGWIRMLSWRFILFISLINRVLYLAVDRAFSGK